MKTTIASIILVSTLFFSLIACSQTKNEKDEIKRVISEFTNGGDQQSGTMISNAFRDGAGFYATNNRDKVLSVTPIQLAEMHEAKKFGGRVRKVTIENVEIDDNIIGFAKVIAEDDVVHYVYYITLSRIDEKWLIQSVLQHSKMK